MAPCWGLNCLQFAHCVPPLQHRLLCKKHIVNYTTNTPVYYLHWALSTIFLVCPLSGGLLSKGIKCLRRIRAFYHLPCSSQPGLRLPVLKSISPIISLAG